MSSILAKVRGKLRGTNRKVRKNDKVCKDRKDREKVNDGFWSGQDKNYMYDTICPLNSGYHYPGHHYDKTETYCVNCFYFRTWYFGRFDQNVIN